MSLCLCTHKQAIHTGIDSLESLPMVIYYELSVLSVFIFLGVYNHNHVYLGPPRVFVLLGAYASW